MGHLSTPVYKIWKKFPICSNLKNDPMNAKNAEITNYGIMHIFN